MTSNNNKTPPPPPPISLSSVSSSEEAVPTTAANWKARLEEIDHKLSKFIFQWQVPAMVEYVWSVPGNFFGIPLAALFIIPSWSVVALEVLLWNKNERQQAQQQGYDYYSYYWTHWWMVGLYVWTFLLLFAWNRLLNGDKKYIELIYGPKTGAMAPLMGVAWIYLYPTSVVMDDDQHSSSNLYSHGHHKLVGYYLIAAWSMAVLPIAYVKPWGKRRRPAAHPAWRVQYGRRKHLHVLPELLAQDANASFPSGDVAGAVAWAHGMSVAYLQNSDDNNAIAAYCRWGIVVVVVTALGRSYWLAHHVADTLAGALLPLVPLMMLDWILSTSNTGLVPGQATAEMALTCFFCLAVQVVAIRKYHKKQLFGAGTMHE